MFKITYNMKGNDPVNEKKTKYSQVKSRIGREIKIICEILKVRQFEVIFGAKLLPNFK